MSWQVFKVIFSLQSPLHIGGNKQGNIIRTRLYVPGRVLWGALTNCITIRQGSHDYIGVGGAVAQYLPTSYFYPCLDSQGQRVILPWLKDYRMSYKLKGKEIDSEMLERCLLTSYVSTAVEPESKTAEDGSLHEIELLNNRLIYNLEAKNRELTGSKGEQLYLTGYIFLSDNAPCSIKDFWEKALSSLRLGGERCYGFGQISLENINPTPPDFFGSPFKIDQNQIAISLKKGQPVLGHALIPEEEIEQGILEPFLGRETSREGSFGVCLSNGQVTWVPGSLVAQDKEYLLGEKGVIVF